MKAKKSLGQNFLKSKKVLFNMVKASEVKTGGIVLEIGPGKGALTEKLLSVGAQVVAIEKDTRLIPYLKEKFSVETKNGQLVIVEDDVLNFNFTRQNFAKQNLGGQAPYLLTPNSYKVVANIPYYITGKLIRFFLENEYPPSSMTLLLQKEVAERIVARPNSHVSRASDKKESLLSISVKIYGEPKYYGKVSKKYFSPQPKVDSAIISIKNIHSPFKNRGEHDLFFKIIRAGFTHKRKVLISNLSQIFPKEKIAGAFKKCDINEKSRAENLSVEKWRCLMNKY